MGATAAFAAGNRFHAAAKQASEWVIGAADRVHGAFQEVCCNVDANSSFEDVRREMAKLAARVHEQPPDVLESAVRTRGQLSAVVAAITGDLPRAKHVALLCHITIWSVRCGIVSGATEPVISVIGPEVEAMANILEHELASVSVEAAPLLGNTLRYVLERVLCPALAPLPDSLELMPKKLQESVLPDWHRLVPPHTCDMVEIETAFLRSSFVRQNKDLEFRIHESEPTVSYFLVPTRPTLHVALSFLFRCKGVPRICPGWGNQP